MAVELQLSDVSRGLMTMCHVTRILARQDADNVCYLVLLGQFADWQ